MLGSNVTLADLARSSAAVADNPTPLTQVSDWQLIASMGGNTLVQAGAYQSVNHGNTTLVVFSAPANANPAIWISNIDPDFSPIKTFMGQLIAAGHHMILTGIGEGGAIAEVIGPLTNIPVVSLFSPTISSNELFIVSSISCPLVYSTNRKR